ncbi:MAG: DUF4922 domain-containing protein, partial [Bacteroidaceae bacterium]|nr:DUF4922 domain-containing protein [Bacteroidaceae bacterium]
MNIKDFYKDQLNCWELAKKNYSDLANVKVKPLVLSNGACIKVQCNPARIVSTGAKIDKAAIAKRPCFLCDKNRPTEQKSLEFCCNFYETK